MLGVLLHSCCVPSTRLLLLKDVSFHSACILVSHGFFCLFSLSFFLSSFVVLVGLAGALRVDFIRLSISFMVIDVALMSDSIWHVVLVSVRLTISSYVASGFSSIALGLNCFAVRLFCLFSFAYLLT
jgi:hypothetical protein